MPLCGLILFSLAFFTSAAEFYVAPNGSASGDGSSARPWNLATGLGQPASVRPGDTIWLRGGRYTFPAGGNVLIGLRGTAAAPITVAQYPGESATLDIRGAAQGLFFTNSPNPSGAAYVNFKNFEVTNSDPNRVPGMPVAIYVRLSDHLKFINLIVHDTGEGFSLNPEATNTEVYGCLVYYNGPVGHGIYVQNVAGYKKVIDNVVFNNTNWGIHAFPHANDSTLLNVSLLGNISFNNGLVGAFPPQPDLLLGGDALANNPVMTGNKTYKSTSSMAWGASASGGAFWNQQIGFSVGCSSPTVTNNYLVGTMVFTGCTAGLAMSGNTFVGATLTRNFYGDPTSALTSSTFPSNTWTTNRPSSNQVFVSPNAYETGRAHVIVYNWEGQGSLSINLSNVLTLGSVYEVRNAADFFGARVAGGVFDGGSVQIPLTGLSTASPVGLLAPLPSGPEFNAFEVLTLGSHSVPSPTPSPVPSPTPTPAPPPVAPVPTQPAPSVTPTPTPSATPRGSTPTPTVTPTPTPTPVPTSRIPTTPAPRTGRHRPNRPLPSR